MERVINTICYQAVQGLLFVKQALDIPSISPTKRLLNIKHIKGLWLTIETGPVFSESLYSYESYW